MGRCHTDCLEKPLSKGFRHLGKLIAKHPWWFIIVPIVLSVGFGAGFCFLEQRQINSMEDQFTPVGGAAKAERDFVRIHFPVNDSGNFSVQRMYKQGTFASLIIVSLPDNILNRSIFEEVHALDIAVKGLMCPSNSSFYQLCAQVNGSLCLPANPLLAHMQNIEDVTFTYPMFQNTVFLGLYLGGVTIGPQNRVIAAKALRLLYYLKEDSDHEQDNNLQWLNHFITTIPQKIHELQLKSIKVFYSTSISLKNQLERTVTTFIPYFSITYLVTALFSIVSCMRLDNIRNKIWVTAFGVFSPGLAILTSFGLLLLCGVPFSITVVNAPFLILGVGVDNMFIIISCWQQTKVKDTLEKRMADTYQEAAVSITITTLTDVLAFYIGLMTHFPSVQSFCFYSGTALVFCYLYCICFFGAVLALNGKRESENRHWLTCAKLNGTQASLNSPTYNVCCVGECVGLGAIQETETEHPITRFFHKYYGPFLTNFWTKFIVLFLYLGFLISSIFGCIQIQEGIDIRYLANDGSSLLQFFNEEALYFSEYGPRVMVVVSNDAEYWEIKTRQLIETCMRELEKNYYVAEESTVSWLRTYERLSDMAQLNISGKENFIKHLDLLYAKFPEFKQDVEQRGNEIKASRFFIQTFHLLTSQDEKQMLIQLRKIADNCDVNVIVYHPIFIYLDQYVIIIQSAIQNIIVATAVMLVISLLFIPNPLCSLWVTFTITSIILGVIGFMGYWRVNLDSISMVTLVICIGFSVDFSAHIAYAYVSNKKTNANERVIDALHVLGYPIVQGALSTILGILALCAAESYIFKTFFKIMFLVITFGALHGLVFIPVFLTLFGAYEITCSEKVKPQNTNILTTSELISGCPEEYDNKMRMQELPGNVRPMTTVMNVTELCKFYCYQSCQNNVFTDLQTVSDLKVENECRNNQLQYRRRMLELYLEGKIDPDCP
ncbi:patched domain-containing protein 3-like [Pelobates fuscus]|uniref:patched domain-containing protein 3-like n=1 Tax=Pelobates fuscus TaxID=191477 RepID=UPI002FE4B704